MQSHRFGRPVALPVPDAVVRCGGRGEVFVSNGGQPPLSGQQEARLRARLSTVGEVVEKPGENALALAHHDGVAGWKDAPDLERVGEELEIRRDLGSADADQGSGTTVTNRAAQPGGERQLGGVVHRQSDQRPGSFEEHFAEGALEIPCKGPHQPLQQLRVAEVGQARHVEPRALAQREAVELARQPGNREHRHPALEDQHAFAIVHRVVEPVPALERRDRFSGCARGESDTQQGMSIEKLVCPVRHGNRLDPRSLTCAFLEQRFDLRGPCGVIEHLEVEVEAAMAEVACLLGRPDEIGDRMIGSRRIGERRVAEEVVDRGAVSSVAHSPLPDDVAAQAVSASRWRTSSRSEKLSVGSKAATALSRSPCASTVRRSA